MATYTSWAQLQEAFLGRAHAMDAAIQVAVEGHAKAVYEKSKELMQTEIYDVPVDTYESSRTDVRHTYAKLPGELQRGQGRRGQLRSPGAGGNRWTASRGYAIGAKKRGMYFQEGRGRPKWQRTGNLLASESLWIGKHIAHITNAAGYALPRHDLGLPEGSPEAFVGSSRKSTRIAPWRRRAVNWFEPQRLAWYRRYVWDALSRQ